MRLLFLACALVAFSGTTAAAQQSRWLGRDKALHFAVGAGLAAGGYAVGALAFDAREHRIIVGVSVGLLAGAAKEIRDRRTGGHPSWRDFAWTAAGTAAGATTTWLIDRQRAPARSVSSRRQLPASAGF